MKKQKCVTLFLFVLGISLLFLGIYLGGYKEALARAIRVCLECIGIG